MQNQPLLVEHPFGTAVLPEQRGPASFPAGPFQTAPNYRAGMQQAPGQQAPPLQQPVSLDEIIVALVSVMTAAIKSKYFIILSC